MRNDATWKRRNALWNRGNAICRTSAARWNRGSASSIASRPNGRPANSSKIAAAPRDPNSTACPQWDRRVISRPASSRDRKSNRARAVAATPPAACGASRRRGRSFRPRVRVRLDRGAENFAAAAADVAAANSAAGAEVVVEAVANFVAAAAGVAAVAAEVAIRGAAIPEVAAVAEEVAEAADDRKDFIEQASRMSRGLFVGYLA